MDSLGQGPKRSGGPQAQDKSPQILWRPAGAPQNPKMIGNSMVFGHRYTKTHPKPKSNGVEIFLRMSWVRAKPPCWESCAAFRAPHIFLFSYPGLRWLATLANLARAIHVSTFQAEKQGPVFRAGPCFQWFFKNLNRRNH